MATLKAVLFCANSSSSCNGHFYVFPRNVIVKCKDNMFLLLCNPVKPFWPPEGATLWPKQDTISAESTCGAVSCLFRNH